MSGVGNYCRTDSAVPQSAAGAGPRSSTGLGEWRGWGPWGVGGGGGGGPGPESIYIRSLEILSLVVTDNYNDVVLLGLHVLKH